VKVPEGIVSWRKLSSQLLQPGDNLCSCLHFLDLSLRSQRARPRGRVPFGAALSRH
jgi:hypothetical protein